jgi:glycosyltransferase involved in cell wall biosynthesis
MKNPLVSFCLFTYNQEQYIKEAIEGAFSQTYSPIEIIISDDNSTDSTYDVIQTIVKNYNGYHKVIVNRNEKNIGLVPHVNKILFEYAQGDYILLAAGDDISLPNRVFETISLMEKNPQKAGVSFSKIIINKQSEIISKDYLKNNVVYSIDAAYLKNSSFMVDGSALGFKKDILNVFGKLNDNCQTEDSTFRFRCLLLGGIVLGNDYGILYRIHDTNISRADNIFNLKTDLIAKQYYKDLQTAYKEKLIDNRLYKRLKIKLNHYILARNLDEKILKTKNEYTKIGWIIYRKLVSCFYRSL